MKKARDSQRSRVYKAERAAWENFDTPEFRTVAQCQEYVNDVTYTRFWDERFTDGWYLDPEVRIEVSDGRGRRSAAAFCDEDRIALPKWARNRLVILHELAHILVNGNRSLASHGPEFVSMYLSLVREFEGEDEAQKLHEAFETHRVKIA